MKFENDPFRRDHDSGILIQHKTRFLAHPTVPLCLAFYSASRPDAIGKILRTMAGPSLIFFSMDNKISSEVQPHSSQ